MYTKNMSIRLIDEVKYLIKRLNAAGFGAWAVGGCVRDGILGRVIHDWDVCTSATPERMEAALSGERIIRTGVKHGTLTIVIGSVPIETTTLRSDGGYADHRRPESVRFVKELTLDLARRDFTVNSMAYNDADGLIDPFAGLNDLEKSVIKCVGDAENRFNEDALRILRAVRFASQLDFAVEPLTAEAALEKRNDLSFVSRERVYSEVVKLLEGAAAARVVRAYSEIVRAALSAESLNLDFKYLPRDAAIALTLLLGNRAPEAASLLKADGGLTTRVKALSEMSDYPAVQTEKDALRLLRLAKSDQAALDFFEYRRCKGVVFDESALRSALYKCHSVAKLNINGEDLKKLGYSGRAIGRELEQLLTLVIEGEIENERGQLCDKAAKAIDIAGKM